MITLEGADREECLALRKKYYDKRVATGIKWQEDDLAEAVVYRELLLAKYNACSRCHLDMQCALIFQKGENRHPHPHA